MAKMIGITDEGAFLSSEAMMADELIRILMLAALNAMKEVVNNTEEEHRQACKEELYDYFNKSASAVLETFAPEIELRPDLTTEAILKAENEILDENGYALKAEPDTATGDAPKVTPISEFIERRFRTKK